MTKKELPFERVLCVPNSAIIVFDKPDFEPGETLYADSLGVPIGFFDSDSEAEVVRKHMAAKARRDKHIQLMERIGQKLAHPNYVTDRLE
jgi:hypothetical protein